MLAKSTKSFLIGAGLAGGIAVVALGSGLMLRGSNAAAPSAEAYVATAASVSPAGVAASIDPSCAPACADACDDMKKSSCSTKKVVKAKSSCASGCSH